MGYCESGGKQVSNVFACSGAGGQQGKRVNRFTMCSQEAMEGMRERGKHIRHVALCLLESGDEGDENGQCVNNVTTCSHGAGKTCTYAVSPSAYRRGGACQLVLIG